MDRGPILSCLDKRELLNQSVVAVEKLIHCGWAFEEADLVHDAVDFYEKAKSREDLTRLLDRAKEEGDLFLFRRILKILHHEPGSEEWLTLARKAQEAGKVTFASEATQLAGRVDTGVEGTEGASAGK